MKPHEKTYIFERAGKDSAEQIAEHLRIKERAVRRFLERKRSEKTLRQDTRSRSFQPLHESEPLQGWHRFLPFIIVLAGLAAYSNTFSAPFTFDDYHGIMKNQTIRSLWPLGPILSRNRPLVEFSLAINYALGGLNVFGYHVFNLAIHLLAALVLFGLARRTLQRRGTACRAPTSTHLAFPIALLWVVHPLNTQAVTYVIQRSESMAGLFYLFTLYAVSRCVHSRGWKVAAFLSCALGMLTKEIMVTMPFLALAYDRIFIAQSWREIVKRRKGFYLGLFVTWLLLAGTYLRQDAAFVSKTAGFGLERTTPLAYALTEPGVILHYLRLAFWPHPLILDYLWPIARTAEVIVPALIIILFLLAAILVSLRLRPAIGFWGAWFFLILLPTSSFMPILDPAQEHRMYLPLAAVAALSVIASNKSLRALQDLNVIGGRGRFVSAAALVIASAAVLAVLTYKRNQDYSSEVSIWRDTVEKRPLNARARGYLATALLRAGDLNEAVKEFEASLRISPEYADSHNNLATILARQGKIEEAVTHYKAALRARPTIGMNEIHYNLANALRRLGKTEEAIDHYEKSLALNPNFEPARRNLALAIADRNKKDETRHKNPQPN